MSIRSRGCAVNDSTAPFDWFDSASVTSAGCGTAATSKLQHVCYGSLRVDLQKCTKYSIADICAAASSSCEQRQQHSVMR
jgi:hypothetical protein